MRRLNNSLIIIMLFLVSISQTAYADNLHLIMADSEGNCEYDNFGLHKIIENERVFKDSEHYCLTRNDILYLLEFGSVLIKDVNVAHSGQIYVFPSTDSDKKEDE